MKKIIFILLFGVLLFIETGCQPVKNKFGERYYPITKVVDGDTFWVDDGSSKGKKIRLIGIDAPEPRKNFNKPEQYYGKEASAYAKKLLMGKSVRLVMDLDTLDPFGRTLAYAYLPDGTFINAHLVKHGYALISTVLPNVRYADLFARMQREARHKKRGLWAKPAF